MRTTLYKIANQAPNSNREFAGIRIVLCSKCRVIMQAPFRSSIFNTSFQTGKHNTMYYVFHYVGTPHFIIESKSGYASTYCSEYCMKKHNAIFTKK